MLTGHSDEPDHARQRVAAIGRRVNILCQSAEGLLDQLVLFQTCHIRSQRVRDQTPPSSYFPPTPPGFT